MKENLPFFKITENWQGITEKSNFKKQGNFVMDLQKIGILKNKSEKTKKEYPGPLEELLQAIYK